MTRRLIIVALTATLALGILAAPGGAASGPNPCKVLKKAEIAGALGGTVASGRKGIATAVSTTCEFAVGAAGNRPAGTVSVHVMTIGAKAAFDGLPKISSDYQPMTELPNALYSSNTGTIDMLVGSKLVGVQGVFLGDDGRADVQAQMIQLAKLARRRV